MIGLWSRRNRMHLEKHGVEAAEAWDVAANAQPPYPERVGDEKWSVWGKTSRGRFLQVIFVMATMDEVEADEYENLQIGERMAMTDGAEAIRIIHARDLTEAEKRRLRRRERGRR